jgi:hypothetical protein
VEIKSESFLHNITKDAATFICSAQVTSSAQNSTNYLKYIKPLEIKFHYYVQLNSTEEC